MKKITSLILTAILLFSFSSCREASAAPGTGLTRENKNTVSKTDKFSENSETETEAVTETIPQNFETETAEIIETEDISETVPESYYVESTPETEPETETEPVYTETEPTFFFGDSETEKQYYETETETETEPVYTETEPTFFFGDSETEIEQQYYETEPEYSAETEAESETIRPEFKAAMDAYEEFYIEYCEVLKKYNENPSDLNLILNYTSLMAKFVDVNTAFEAWDESEMNNEELKYYLDVNNRVAKMLVDAAG